MGSIQNGVGKWNSPAFEASAAQERGGRGFFEHKLNVKMKQSH